MVFETRKTDGTRITNITHKIRTFDRNTIWQPELLGAVWIMNLIGSLILKGNKPKTLQVTRWCLYDMSEISQVLFVAVSDFRLWVPQVHLLCIWCQTLALTDVVSHTAASQPIHRTSVAKCRQVFWSHAIHYFFHIRFFFGRSGLFVGYRLPFLCFASSLPPVSTKEQRPKLRCTLSLICVIMQTKYVVSVIVILFSSPISCVPYKYSKLGRSTLEWHPTTSSLMGN